MQKKHITYSARIRRVLRSGAVWNSLKQKIEITCSDVNLSANLIICELMIFHECGNKDRKKRSIFCVWQRDAPYQQNDRSLWILIYIQFNVWKFVKDRSIISTMIDMIMLLTEMEEIIFLCKGTCTPRSNVNNVWISPFKNRIML